MPLIKQTIKLRLTKVSKKKLGFALLKNIKNNFIVFYLLLLNASPRKLQPYYRTFIYILIRQIAKIIIKIKQSLSFKNFKLPKINRAEIISYLPRLSMRAITMAVIFAVITVQVLNVGAFEAHVINVTAKIVNDVPKIEPDGGEFCNINGATITITTTLTGTSTIIYTTDGSNPVCPATGNIYTAPFIIYQSTTVKARTCHDGKQSAVMSKDFNVSNQFCGQPTCNAETIDYWVNNQGCENDPAVSQLAAQINNLSLTNFQGAFAAITGEEICTSFDLTVCPPENTLTGELCRARGQTLADLSNIVSGRLDLNAVIAGAFNNNAAFNNLGLNASSTVEQSLDKIENILNDLNPTVENLANAKYVAQRIYTFYNSENPYAPEPTCIYYEPGDVILNEFVPNPACSSQPEDVVFVMDRSGSMGYDIPTRLSKAKTAANEFINNMQTNDQSALVSYSYTAILNKQLSHDHAATQSAINNLVANGATNIGDAFALANTELTSVRASSTAAKVEILLTDGMANMPNGPGFDEWPADVTYAKAKADEASAQGIKIFTIGLGTSVNASMLEYIATTTGAQYHYAPNGDALKAIYKLISEELCGAGDNDQYLKGLDGEWAELYNKGNAQKDLTDWMIANASTTPAFKINSDNMLASSTAIGAAGWAVALFNEARLNNFGDTIFLYDNNGHLLDFYSYLSSIDNDTDNDPYNTPGTANTLDGNLAGLEGKSFARIPDGTGDWIDPIPTPGGPNLLEENLILNDEIVDEIASSSEEIASDQNTADPPSANSNCQILDNTGSDITDNMASQPENNQADNNLVESNNQNEEVILTDGNLNNSDENADLPAPDSSLDPVLTTEQNAEPDGQATENNNQETVLPGEETSAPASNIVEIGVDVNAENNNLLNAPTEAKTESVPEPAPSEDKPAVIDAPQEQATEPTAATPTEATPNGETTAL